MKILLSLFLLISFISCANHRNETENKNLVKSENPIPLAYGGHCPMGLCQKKMVKGKEKFKVDYKDKRYLFSSEASRDKFLSNIEHHIKKADEHWHEGNADRSR